MLGNTYIDLYFQVIDKIVMMGIKEEEFANSVGGLHLFCSLIEAYAYTNQLDTILE